MEPITPNFVEHILMIFLVIILPASALMHPQPDLSEENFDTNTKLQTYIGNGTALWILTLIVALIWFFSGRALPAIGFRMPNLGGQEWLVLVITFVLLYAFDTWNDIRTEERRLKTMIKWERDTPFLPANALEFRHFVILAFTAGFCEEVIFRGYFIQYFMSFTGDSFLGIFIAIALPGVAFSVSHLYQGWKAVAKIMVLSIIFGLIFLTTQSLWIVILLHFLVDLIGGYIAWRMYERYDSLKQ